LHGTLDTVTPGKTADLVVCQGDPVANIRLLGDAADVMLVMQEGRIVRRMHRERSMACSTRRT
jgi:imidazolonepropionase-like amidohydrolase